MIRSLSFLERALGVLCVVLIAAFWWRTWQLHRVEKRAAATALRADTLTASLDSSHAVALSRRDSLRILGDSLRAVTRRVVQVAQRNDALDKAQGLDRIALANLTAAVRELRVTAQPSAGPVRMDTVTGARSARFAIDTTPYRGSAFVSLPASGAGLIDLRLSIDTARVALRLGCGAAVDGIRSASATVTGPPWLSLALGRVEQSPDLCRSPALEAIRARPPLWRRVLGSCGVGPSYAVVFAAGKVYAGPGGAVSCRLWP